MKTTIELPDDLLRAAKSAAVQRGISLKDLLTHALEREVRPPPAPRTGAFTVGEDGIPYLPARGAVVTSDLVARLLDEDSGG